MANLCKAGKFSDGGDRFVVAASGYNADPVPTTPSAVIFNSDWGELFPSKTGFYGSTPFSAAGTQISISFPSTLSFVPFVFCAYRLPTDSNPNWAADANTFLQGVYRSIAPDEVYADHFLVTPPNASGNTASGTLLWMVILSPASAAPASGGRTGTQWMSWSASGPCVAKIGQSISATDPSDFLIPPASSGYILNSMVATGYGTSVPFWETQANSSGTTYQLYKETISHGLGYVPFCFFQCPYNFIAPNGLVTADLCFDNDNIYIVAFTVGTAAASLSVNPFWYAISRTQWV